MELSKLKTIALQRIKEEEIKPNAKKRAPLTQKSAIAIIAIRLI